MENGKRVPHNATPYYLGSTELLKVLGSVTDYLENGHFQILSEARCHDSPSHLALYVIDLSSTMSGARVFSTLTFAAPLKC